MKLSKLLWAGAALGTMMLSGALADVVMTVGSGTTIFAFVCQSTKVCPASVSIDTAGNALVTAPGTGNTSFALPIQGVASGVAVPITGALTGALPTGGNTIGKVDILGNAAATLDAL